MIATAPRRAVSRLSLLVCWWSPLAQRSDSTPAMRSTPRAISVLDSLRRSPDGARRSSAPAGTGGGCRSSLRRSARSSAAGSTMRATASGSRVRPEPPQESVDVVSALTDLQVDARASKIETTIHLVLVLHEYIGTHGGFGFEIASAMKVGGIVDVAGSSIDRGFRIWTQGTSAAGGRRGGTARCQQRVRSHSVFHPTHESHESIDRTRPGSVSAMGNAWRTEQAIEVLNVPEAPPTARAVTRRHLAIVVDHPA